MLWTDDVARAGGFEASDKNALLLWCARYAVVYVQFAPGKSWEQLAAETLSEGYIRMAVERPFNT